MPRSNTTLVRSARVGAGPPVAGRWDPLAVGIFLPELVTIPPLDPLARDEEEPDYDEEAQVWAAAMEHTAEVIDEETPDEYDWQISRLVSATTYIAGPDAGRVSTGRMKIT